MCKYVSKIGNIIFAKCFPRASSLMKANCMSRIGWIKYMINIVRYVLLPVLGRYQGHKKLVLYQVTNCYILDLHYAAEYQESVSLFRIGGDAREYFGKLLN